MYGPSSYDHKWNAACGYANPPGSEAAKKAGECRSDSLVDTLRAVGFDVIAFDEDGPHFEEISRPEPVAVPDPRAPRAPVSSGIADHSTESPFTTYVLFAVGDLLRAAQFTAWATAAGLPFKQGIGSWKGEQERCFIVPEVDALMHDLTPWLAGQETVLRLGPAYRDGIMYGHRHAELIDVSPTGAWLGPFASSQYAGLYGWIGETHAPAAGDWTWFPDQGFFAIRDNNKETPMTNSRPHGGGIGPY